MEIKDTLFTPYIEIATLSKVYKTEKGKEFLTGCLQEYLENYLLSDIERGLEGAISRGAKGWGDVLSTPPCVDTRYEDNVKLIKTLYKRVINACKILENEMLESKGK